MNSIQEILLQCPCSGGGAHPLLLLAMFAGMWLIFSWAKRLFKSEGVTRMNRLVKVIIVLVLVAGIGAVIAMKNRNNEPQVTPDPPSPLETTEVASLPRSAAGLPKMIDLGAGKCIPCKMMAPILEELKKEYQGRFDVVFVDVWEKPDEAKRYGINIIPTQIFFDASGKELFRHEGFFSREDILGTWKQFGFDFNAAKEEAFSRLEPAKVDVRHKDNICYMCDGDIDPAAAVTVTTEKGPVRLCGAHCYFIMYSCLTEDKTDFEKKVTFTDAKSGTPVSAAEAVFLCGEDETTGRPWVKAFADRAAAVEARAAEGGSIVSLQALAEKELSHRCGFCDRSCYPQDAAEVIVEGGVHTWGCCSHCALGVAARTGKDIEVRERDRLTGERIVMKTLDGKVASLEPTTAVAWFGQRKKPDGSWMSAGCFHQGFFTSADNLKKWVEVNPLETGQMISISQALADKMKLSPEQIQKACKIGECAPK